MARPKKKYHYIYKTTCNVTKKYYIGMHSTSDLEDDYMGSGKRLRYSIRKHGVENHTREILEFLNDRESLAKREAEIVNEELINDPLCMNLKCGGYGGFSNEEHQRRFIESSKHTRFSTESNPSHCKDKQLKASLQLKKLWDEGKIPVRRGCFKKGERHKPETIEKLKGHTRQCGEKNSQYGKPRSEETKRKISESLKKRNNKE